MLTIFTTDNCSSEVSGMQNNVTIDDCTALESNMNALILGTLCITAIIFLIVMSFLEQRSSFKLKCLGGRPGAIIPLNLLDGYENRFAYSLAFGVTTSYCLSVILKDAQSVLGEEITKIILSSPPYVNVFFKMIATVMLATGAYPLFVCVGTKFRLCGSIFGLLYTITWFSLFCYKTSVLFKPCFSSKKSLLAFDMVMELPQYVCLLLLIMHFLRHVVVFLRARLRMCHQYEGFSSPKNDYMQLYVSNLLTKKQTDPLATRSSLVHRTRSWIRKRIFQCQIGLHLWKLGNLPPLKCIAMKIFEGFKFSTRVVCTFMVCFLTIYMLTVYLIELSWMLLDKTLEPFVESDKFNQTFGNSFGPGFVSAARIQVKIWILCCYIAIISSSLKTYLVFFNMLSWYRHHLTRLRVGDRSWLPKAIKSLNDSPASLTAASMKYAGYQVAYAAWGYLIFVFVLWLTLGLCSSLIFYPLFHGESSVLLTAIYKLWPALLITMFLFIAQRITARYCFLFKQGKIIAITNRKAFNIVSYYLFFFNIFLGILSCLLRILKSLVVGVTFIERVQRSVLPSSFEIIDPGYYSYVGCIHIEHTLANPVLRVFLSSLKETIDDMKLAKSRAETLENVASANQRSMLEENAGGIGMAKEKYRNARNKWNVAYTLIKNPTLCQLRKSRLAAVKHVEELDKEIEEITNNLISA